MPTGPDLSQLENDYQILTELHRSDDAHTFLARHLELNRDVTITVIRGADAESMQSYDADTQRLVSLRHPNVIPVIEGRWLAAADYAVVHARVRGSTLDQLVSAVGGMALPRAAGALQQVDSALEWARENSIVNRHVTPDELVFQQGSGRVLLALTPASRFAASGVATPGNVGVGDHPGACADAHTIGELAFMMLSGHRVEDVGTQSLATLCPDLPRALVAQTETLLRCDARSGVPDVAAYIALLTPVAPRQAPPVVVTDTEVPVPLARQADAVVVVAHHGMSFGARFATAIVVLGVLGAAAAVIVNRRGQPNERAAMGDHTQSAPTNAEAAGEIALRARQSDSILASHVPPPPPITRRVSVADTPRSEPPVTRTPALAVPESTTRPSVPPPDSAPPTDVCDSPASADQHRCLMNAVEKNDAELNGVYQRAIAALRKQAGVLPDDPDPSTVEQLRATQRRWLEDRDVQCRAVGTGLLFARDRAACFSDQSNKRTHDLQQILDGIPATVPSPRPPVDTMRRARSA
jgi:uncharacterized protein YecT (DUF1311 family)